jgi:hypothetical protein
MRLRIFEDQDIDAGVEVDGGEILEMLLRGTTKTEGRPIVMPSS